ncbi:MAG TPA: S1 RNA-binding domain-containing protein, partial [bacterium]|nr:S1 RNA-binding domain-containing protein [bacterium]
RADLQSRYSVGATTLGDIIGELAKPNRDPREEYPAPILQQGVLTFEDLSEGMRVTGKVKNVVDFGAFVDIGIKETALLHVSEMSTRFIEDPMELLKVGDVKEFRIIALDQARRRISLSLKPQPTQPRQPQEKRGAAAAQKPGAAAAQKPGAAAGQKPGAAAGQKPGAAGPDARPEAPPPPRAPRPRRPAGDRPESREHADGTVYNPFADLLKKRNEGREERR